jgi:ABC-type transport system substrate-binding protein
MRPSAVSPPVRSLLTVLCVLVTSLQPAVAAGPEKVLRLAFRSVETGFDPQRVDDLYSSAVNDQLFEPLLEFDYLARPARLVPLVAQEVPQAEQGGLVYTFRIRPGIYFQDDPVFEGQRRELVARDVEYALKRLVDPQLRAPYAWLVQDKIAGLAAARDRALKSGRFDYDAPVEGLAVIDRYTLRLRLNSPDYNFIYIFSMPQTAPVAREVIEAYAADTMAHPVGTGPFRLAEWVRRSKIVLVRNPDHRGLTLNTTWADASDETDRRIVAALRGKRLPQLDRVEIYPIEEEQPRFLAFMGGEHDILQETPAAFIHQVVPNDRLAPNLAAAGVTAHRELAPSITYDMFNMENPLVGGYTPEKVALRRALVLGHDLPTEIAIVRKGQVMEAQSPIPPGVVGYDPAFTATEVYNPARAKALLDLYGYVDRNGDGWRDQPDGSPLVIDYMHTTGGQSARQLAAIWVKSMSRIGIRLVPRAVQFSDHLRERQAGKYMLAGGAWAADYPDAQNFLQLLYGPNSGQSNDTRFRLPAYDSLYEQALRMPDSAERNRLYREMSRLVLAYAPWRLATVRSYVHLTRPWVLGYKKHPMNHINIKYLDIDVDMRAKAAL